MRTGIVLISTQNPPIYNPRYQGEQGKTGYIKSVSEGGILKRVLRFYTCIHPIFYKYPKIFQKNKQTKTPNQKPQVTLHQDKCELPFRFAFVSELPFRFAFVSEWSPNTIRYVFFLAWFVKHGLVFPRPSIRMSATPLCFRGVFRAASQSPCKRGFTTDLFSSSCWLLSVLGLKSLVSFP